MTLTLLNELGVSTRFDGNSIGVDPLKTIEENTIVVESDWSSASYFYSLIALSGIGATITLSSYRKRSLQGDSCLVDIYKDLGVTTSYHNNSITLTKTYVNLIASETSLKLDLRNAPDIAQTIAVTCFGLGLACDLTGLHTLKIKETDRLVALKNELTKLGAEISITDESLHLRSSSVINRNISISTYNDHRMAMAFAPLSLIVPITILDAEVVTKSYTDFWDHFRTSFQER
jgi:3-phosphoshikimate 1-carboxyvinyltransferase